MIHHRIEFAIAIKKLYPSDISEQKQQQHQNISFTSKFGDKKKYTAIEQFHHVLRRKLASAIILS